MWYQAGITYTDLLEIKLEKQRESNARPSPRSLSKINNIITKGLMHFNSFLKSFEGKINQIDESYYQSYGRAQFFIAVLHGKFITLDKKVKLENTEASLEAYEKVLEFCDGHEGAQDTIKLEIEACKEMVKLLPVKIVKLKSELPKQS
ncbi:hypothetical protein HHI36_010400 [Cryptolaemus montrouzieri]|uniref:KIF-binding protein n=1 Tax=Cryptolaemus montrouzieri TaxID=559131 RepID=A0ABD2MIN6_9CUCU